MRSAPLHAALALLFGAGGAFACLWDYDTLEMERQRFPDVLEIIAGKVLRHSPAFYEWRARDRQQRLSATPDDLRLLDDLAVALDKLGRHDEAIATARRAEQLAPERYETLANLGTLLIHAGRPAEGLPYLKHAIRVNPDAHFGREKWQIALVEYVVARAPRQGAPGYPAGRNGQLLPLQLDREEQELVRDVGEAEPMQAPRLRAKDATDFATFLGQPPRPELEAAIKGVCGMLVFGSNDSPVLLEALGDLLRATAFGQDGQQRLAARAYLRAGLGVEGPARAAYRALARGALGTQWKVTLEQVEAELAAELEEGRAWLAGIEADERAWIEAGRDPEAEFGAKYYAAPRIGPPEWVRVTLDLPRRIPLVALPIGVLVLYVGLRLTLLRRRHLAHAAP